MAEDHEKIISCDHCDAEIKMRDWMSHLRDCFTNRKKEEKFVESESMSEEENDENIPCEFCEEQVSANEWRSHSRKCADAHRRRIENLKNGIDDEPIDAFIPCEYCNVQISVHELEWHTRQCADKQKRETNQTNEDQTVLIPCEYCNSSIKADEWKNHMNQCGQAEKHLPRSLNDTTEKSNVLLPCEFCEEQVSANEWRSHSRKCADAHRRRIENLKNGINDEPIDALIPCEYCNVQISVHELEWHTRQCADKQKRETNQTNEDQTVLIPCEYCNGSIKADEWKNHMNQCGQAEKHLPRSLNDTTEKSNVLLPCEFCEKTYSMDKIETHQRDCRRKSTISTFDPNSVNDQTFATPLAFPKNWDLSSPQSFSRHTLDSKGEEYAFVAENFRKTLRDNKIIKIDRIQNRRWFRQYDAHKEDFIERYGKSTEQWLFHGVRESKSVEAIIHDCFNRSHAVNCAVGQGIYFATDAAISHGYTHSDRKHQRHMFMARVLVGKTTAGNSTTRVCPAGYDTTGGGSVFVTYHDAQAYGEYVIIYK